MLLDQSVETGPGNPQNLRGLTLNSSGSAEDSLNVGGLHGLHGVIHGLEGIDTALLRFRFFKGQVLHVDDSTPAKDDRPGQSMLQFPDVPWPIV